MIRTTSLVVLAAACGMLTACDMRTPEQKAAEELAKGLQQMGVAMGAAMGQAAGQTTINGQPVDPNQAANAFGAAMGAAMGGAAASGALNDPSMSAEDRAKAQAVMGAMAGGQANPAVAAWVAGATKAYAILGQVKDVAGANAAKAQLAPIYAEMTGPAATLKAMTDDQRDVAIASSAPQLAAVSLSAMTLMGPLMSKPEVQRAVSELLDAMPQME